MHALVLYFDEQSNKHFKSIRSYFNKEGVSDYDVNNLAHITIASFENLNVDKWVSDIKEHTFDKLTVKLSSIGSFVGSETLYYAPVMTKALFDFHNSYYQRMSGQHNHHDMYSPDCWIPHATIASRLGTQFNEALEYVSGLNTIVAQVEKIALIEVFVNDHGVASGSEIVWERSLY